MNKEITTIKVTVDSRKNLKLLSAMLGITLIELVERLAEEALKKEQEKDDITKTRRKPPDFNPCG